MEKNLRRWEINKYKSRKRSKEVYQFGFGSSEVSRRTGRERTFSAPLWGSNSCRCISTGSSDSYWDINLFIVLLILYRLQPLIFTRNIIFVRQQTKKALWDRSVPIVIDIFSRSCNIIMLIYMLHVMYNGWYYNKLKRRYLRSVFISSYNSL